MPRTFIIRLRGDVEGLIEHEYLCPLHGRFLASVVRADPPDNVPCKLDLFCREQAWWSPTAMNVNMPVASAGSKARDDVRPHEGFMSTRNIADGQSVKDWKAERATYWETQRKRGAKDMP